MIQQPNTSAQNQLTGGQVIQTAEGQTIIYQPVQQQQQQQQSGESSQVQTIQLSQGSNLLCH